MVSDLRLTHGISAIWSVDTLCTIVLQPTMYLPRARAQLFPLTAPILVTMVSPVEFSWFQPCMIQLSRYLPLKYVSKGLNLCLCFEVSSCWMTRGNGDLPDLLHYWYTCKFIVTLSTAWHWPTLTLNLNHNFIVLQWIMSHIFYTIFIHYCITLTML